MFFTVSEKVISMIKFSPFNKVHLFFHFSGNDKASVRREVVKSVLLL